MTPRLRHALDRLFGPAPGGWPVDDHASSGLPPHQKAALALTDAMIWHPADLPDTLLDEVRAHLTPAQAVELGLDVCATPPTKSRWRSRAKRPG